MNIEKMLAVTLALLGILSLVLGGLMVWLASGLYSVMPYFSSVLGSSSVSGLSIGLLVIIIIGILEILLGIASIATTIVIVRR